MSLAGTPAELEILALADPYTAIRQAQSTCIIGVDPSWRDSLLFVLRPWWENATVAEMAEWLDRWAAYDPRVSTLSRPRRYIRLGCLVAKCMDLQGDADAAAELARIEAWAFSNYLTSAFRPVDLRVGGWSYLRAVDHLSEAIWHQKWSGQLADFFGEAYHASNGEDFAPLIRAALPLETMVP